MNLLLLHPHEVDGDGVVRLTGPRARHLIDVLRVTSGQVIRVGVLDGPLGTGDVSHVQADAVHLRCHLGRETPPRPGVDLLLALPRPKVLRRLWAQLAAIGVGRIMLVNAERVERDYFGTHLLSPDVYVPLLIEGLQQARDTRLPIVSLHRRLKPFVEDELDAHVTHGHRLLAHPGVATPLAAVLRPDPAPEQVLIAVGPEGGWNEFERGLLIRHRFQPVDLGARTLRTDTACVALLSVVHAEMRRE